MEANPSQLLLLWTNTSSCTWHLISIYQLAPASTMKDLTSVFKPLVSKAMLWYTCSSQSTMTAYLLNWKHYLLNGPSVFSHLMGAWYIPSKSLSINPFNIQDFWMLNPQKEWCVPISSLRMQNVILRILHCWTKNSNPFSTSAQTATLLENRHKNSSIFKMCLIHFLQIGYQLALKRREEPYPKALKPQSNGMTYQLRIFSLHVEHINNRNSKQFYITLYYKEPKDDEVKWNFILLHLEPETAIRKLF